VHLPDDTRAELDHEEQLAAEVDLPTPLPEAVPDDVLAERDAEARALAEVPGDDGQRPAPLDDARERYRQA